MSLKTLCTHGIAPRIHTNSSYHQAQAFAREIFNKRFTRNSLKLLALPPTASASDSSIKSNLASSTTAINNFRYKHVKNSTRPSIKKKFQHRNYSKLEKVKRSSLQRTLKFLSEKAVSGMKVQHCTSMPCADHSAMSISSSKLDKTNATSSKKSNLV